MTDQLGPFNAWLIPGAVVVAAVGTGLLWLARGIDPTLRRRLVLAGLVFLAGAVGMEGVGAAFALTSDLQNPWLTTPYHVLVGLEEGLEMTGALIALRAAVQPVRVRISAATPGPVLRDAQPRDTLVLTGGLRPGG